MFIIFIFFFILLILLLYINSRQVKEFFINKHPIFYNKVYLDGLAILLNPGDYTKDFMKNKLNFNMNSILSMDIPKGYLVKIYTGLNYDGNVKTFKGPIIENSLTGEFFKNINSIKIVKI